MKKIKLSKTAVWWLIFLAIIVAGAVFYGTIGALSAGFVYLIINSFIFWGKVLGFAGFIAQTVFKKEELSEEIYKLSIKQKNTTPYSLSSYGITLLKRGDTDTSLQLFKRVSAMARNNILLQKSAITNQALCYWQKGEIDTAISMLVDCETRFDYINPDTYATLGYLYILKKDYDKALECTNKALEDDKNHASALDNLGQIYYRLGDLDKAEIYFNKALDIKSMLADSNYYLGIIAEEKNNLESAKKYFETAHNCNINVFNTISKDQVEEKYFTYSRN